MRLVHLCITAAMAASASRAQERLPLTPPRGPFAVGSIARQLIDSSRIDSIVAPPARREVMVRAWYPASRRAGAPRAPYIPNLTSAEGRLGTVIATVTTNSDSGAPFDASVRSAPVVLLATGRAVGANDYTMVAEELASAGFVVIAVESPHQSRVVFPGGRVVPPFAGWAPSRDVLMDFDRADGFFEPMNTIVAADLAFVAVHIDALAIPGAAGRLRTDTYGMMGHSNGAMAGARACAHDTRCIGFLGLEGTQSRDVRRGTSRMPFALVISEQALAVDAQQVYTELGRRGGAPYTVVKVRGGGHNSCTDLTTVSPSLFTYPLAADAGVSICRELALAFWNARFGRPGDAIDDVVKRHAELTVERYN